MVFCVPMLLGFSPILTRAMKFRWTSCGVSIANDHGRFSRGVGRREASVSSAWGRSADIRPVLNVAGPTKSNVISGSRGSSIVIQEPRGSVLSDALSSISSESGRSGQTAGDRGYLATDMASALSASRVRSGDNDDWDGGSPASPC